MPNNASTWTPKHTIGYAIGLPLFFGALLFIPAGRVDWLRGWLFLGISAVAMIASVLWMRRVNPEIFAARSRVQPGTKRWDRILIVVIFLAMFAVFIVAALDDGRYGWSRLGWTWLAVGYVLYLGGFAGTAWAQGVNRHFEAGVRIQTDRDHHVVDNGPYRLIRHPGYAFAIVMFAGAALALGSLWALLPVAVVAFDLVIRTAWEDATLQRELPGYAEFAQRTRYRLLPGVW